MDNTYNGWSNRATWAMGLNLSNEEGIYRELESRASTAALGNDPNDPDDVGDRTLAEIAEDFHIDLAIAIEQYARYCAAKGLLPDFDPDSHESSDPRDNDGPDDIDEVNWLEIAESYELSDYV